MLVLIFDYNFGYPIDFDNHNPELIPWTGWLTED